MSQVPDAWDDNWENQADVSLKQQADYWSELTMLYAMDQILIQMASSIRAIKD